MGELVDLFAQGLQIGQRQAEAESRQEFREVQMEQAQQEMARMRQAASPEVAQAFMDVHDIDKSPAELREAWSLLFPHKYLLTLAGSGRDTLLKQREQIEKENRQQKLKIKLVEEELKLKDKFGDENATEKYERDTLTFDEYGDYLRSQGATDETVDRLLGGIRDPEGFRTDRVSGREALKTGKVPSRKNFRLEMTALVKRASRGAGADVLKRNEKGQPWRDRKGRGAAFDSALIQFQAENQETPISQLDMTEFADLLASKGFFEGIKTEVADKWYDLIAGGEAGLPSDGGGGDDETSPLAPVKTGSQVIQENFPDLKEFGPDVAIEQLTALLREADLNENGEPTGKVLTDENIALMLAFVDAQYAPSQTRESVDRKLDGPKPFEPKGPPAPGRGQVISDRSRSAGEQAFFTKPGQAVGDRSRGRAPSVKEKKKRTFDPGRISTPGPSRGARTPEIKTPDTLKKIGEKLRDTDRKSKGRASAGFRDKADRKEAKKRLTNWQRTNPGSKAKTFEDFLREVKAERNAR